MVDSQIEFKGMSMQCNKLESALSMQRHFLSLIKSDNDTVCILYVWEPLLEVLAQTCFVRHRNERAAHNCVFITHYYQYHC